MSDDKKNTRINPKHYIGKFASNDVVFYLTSFMLFTGSTIGTGMTIYDNISEVADNQGTEMQAETYARLSEQIHKLDKEQANLEIAQAQYRLDSLNGKKTIDESKIEALKDAFAIKAHATLADIFTHGDIGQEADISEKQVLELTKIFEEKIAPMEDFAVKITPETIVYLDEVRQEVGKDIKGVSPIAQLKDLEKAVNDYKENIEALSILSPILPWLLIFFLGGHILQDKLSDWQFENKRVPKKRRKKNKHLTH